MIYDAICFHTCPNLPRNTKTLPTFAKFYGPPLLTINKGIKTCGSLIKLRPGTICYRVRCSSTSNCLQQRVDGFKVESICTLRYSSSTIVDIQKENVLTTNDFSPSYLCLICHLYQLMSNRHCFEDMTISLRHSMRICL